MPATPPTLDSGLLQNVNGTFTATPIGSSKPSSVPSFNAKAENNAMPLLNTLPKLSLMQLLNLTVGVIGIQFAWSMQIALSHRVLEPLGADPLLYGLIWCAGPITGLLVQPIVGALSDRTWTPLGRRRPYILGGAVLGSLALVAFPYAPTLLIAAALIWVIDAVVNMAQGPYRALVPDTVPQEQTTLANSFLNAGFGVGSVISLGLAPLLQAFNVILSVEQQYILAAIALISLILYTSLLIKEYQTPANEAISEPVLLQEKKPSLFVAFKTYMQADPEVFKISAVQFLTWVGVMCMFIYLTPLVVHQLYQLPDTSQTAYKKGEALFKPVNQAAQKLSEQLSVAQLEKLLQVSSSSPDAFNTMFKQVSPASVTLLQAETMLPVLRAAQQYAASGGLLSVITAKPQRNTERFTTETVSRLARFAEAPTLKQGLQASAMLLPFSQKAPEAQALKAVASQPANTEQVVRNVVLQRALQLKTGKPTITNDTGTSLERLWSAQAQWFSLFQRLDAEATNTAQKALVALNLVALLLSLPLGALATRLGKKPVYMMTLGCMSLAFAAIPFVSTPNELIAAMAVAGVAWSTILSLPFAFLCDYMKKGQEGSLMGIFNMFVAGPQLISATVVSWWITKTPVVTQFGQTHQWNLAFQVASLFLLLAVIMLIFIKEKKTSDLTHPPMVSTGH